MWIIWLWVRTLLSEVIQDKQRGFQYLLVQHQIQSRSVSVSVHPVLLLLTALLTSCWQSYTEKTERRLFFSTLKTNLHSNHLVRFLLRNSSLSGLEKHFCLHGDSEPSASHQGRENGQKDAALLHNEDQGEGAHLSGLDQRGLQLLLKTWRGRKKKKRGRGQWTVLFSWWFNHITSSSPAQELRLVRAEEAL